MGFEIQIEIFNGTPSEEYKAESAGQGDVERRLADESLCFLCLHAGFLPSTSPARFDLHEIDKAEDDVRKHNMFSDSFGIDVHFEDEQVEDLGNRHSGEKGSSVRSTLTHKQSTWNCVPSEEEELLSRQEQSGGASGAAALLSLPRGRSGVPSAKRNYVLDGNEQSTVISSERAVSLSGRFNLCREQDSELRSGYRHAEAAEPLDWSLLGSSSWAERSCSSERPVDGSEGSREDTNQTEWSASFEHAGWSRHSSFVEPIGSQRAASSESNQSVALAGPTYIAVAKKDFRHSATTNAAEVQQSSAAAQLKHWLIFERSVETVIIR